MHISSNYIVVEKLEEEKTEGFQTIKVQDSFVCKGKVTKVPECPVYVDNHPLAVGDVVMFAKYSPDTHEVELEGKKVKFIKTSDLLAVL